MNKKFWKRFLKAAGIRALKTMAQTATSLIGVGVFVSDINWGQVLSASAVAGLLSILTSITAGLPEVPNDPVALEAGTDGK